MEKGTLDQRLQSVLMAYRMTPQKTTGQSPAELFLNRRLSNVLDRLKPDSKRRMHNEFSKQKVDHDRKSTERSFLPGAPVWVQNERTNGCTEGTVERQTAVHSYEVAIDGEVRRKHADQLRERVIPTDEDGNGDAPQMEIVPETTPPRSPTTATAPASPETPVDVPVRRSTRQRHPVDRYGYETPQNIKQVGRKKKEAKKKKV
jgi:hypothetical protein